MNTSTARTTINMSTTLLANLRRYAKRNARTLSEVIEEGVSLVLSRAKGTDLQDMYEGLEKARHQAARIGETNPHYADKSVDEILYGEGGVWKGER